MTTLTYELELGLYCRKLNHRYGISGSKVVSFENYLTNYEQTGTDSGQTALLEPLKRQRGDTTDSLASATSRLVRMLLRAADLHSDQHRVIHRRCCSVLHY